MKLIQRIKTYRISFLSCILVCHFFYNPTDSGAVQLTTSNLDTILVHINEMANMMVDDTDLENGEKRLKIMCGKHITDVAHPGYENMRNPWFGFSLSAVTDIGRIGIIDTPFSGRFASNELVIINFYADWCRFSNMLAPIFDEAATKVQEEFPDEGQVIMGKVDCDKEGAVATRFHITKYPTLKVIRNGQPTKREYRGQRSTEAFLSFIRKQLADPIKEFKDLKELLELEDSKRTVIGYFDRKDVPAYNIFRRVATNLKEDCQFYVGFGEVSERMHPPGTPIVVFRSDKVRSNENDETFLGNLNIYDELNVWASEKCVPLVREITFENAEELTEEGLPFLILFHKPDDNDSVKKFNDIVLQELYTEKQNVNFLTADGVKFAHPLHHLGKSQSDLPLIAIDSFRHMYLFPDIKEMETPGRLKAFLQDLYSGKLHREFHYGPEPVTDPLQQIEGKKPTNPPESTFKKLAPSSNRYTLLRDEL